MGGGYCTYANRPVRTELRMIGQPLRGKLQPVLTMLPVGAMASPTTKAIKRVMPAPRPHWVGDGFHVYPVFSSLAFSAELSPWVSGGPST